MQLTVAENKALKTVQVLGLRIQSLPMNVMDHQQIGVHLHAIQCVILAGAARAEIEGHGVSVKAEQKLTPEEAEQKRIRDVKERLLSKFRPRTAKNENQNV